MMKKTYDLIVIGAGSGGLVAATTANRQGLRTAMLEKSKIGGECTHYGCVPSKALINTAKAYHSLQNMDVLGLSVNATPPIFSRVMNQVDEIVQGIYQHETPDIFQNQGIDVFVSSDGTKFIDPYTVDMGGNILEAKNYIICTGSHPAIPRIEGIDQAHVLHNENFWDMREHPGKIVFIGGGVISVELGQALARLGCDVTIMDRNPRILKVTDEEIGGYITDVIQKEGVKLITHAQLIRFSDSNTLIYQQNNKEKSIEGDYFFVAAGRLANVEGMDLEKAGIEYSPKGIKTNAFLQTTASHIYAAGDVTTKFKFTHTASHQANICMNNILQDNHEHNDLSVLPWGIFTDPEIGHVGMNQVEAEQKYGVKNISIFKVNASIDRFITDRKTGGVLKVIFNESDLVVGAQAVGHLAGEWIQLLTLAIKNKIPATQMADTIFSYPTYSEIVKKVFTRYLRTK